MSFDPLSWKDYVTEAAAAVGAALGLMNTWNGLNQRKVRLRVRPAHAFGVPDGRHMVSIEVINLSTFPLTITEVGFTLDNNRLDVGERAAMAPPILIDGGIWPRKLQPREAVTGLCYPEQLQWQRVGKAYARTACEEVRYGTSPALKSMRAVGSSSV